MKHRIGVDLGYAFAHDLQHGGVRGDVRVRGQHQRVVHVCRWRIRPSVKTPVYADDQLPRKQVEAGDGGRRQYWRHGLTHVADPIVVSGRTIPEHERTEEDGLDWPAHGVCGCTSYITGVERAEDDDESARSGTMSGRRQLMVL